MSFTDEVYNKIPSHLHEEPAFQNLINVIKIEGLDDGKALRSFLDKEVGFVQKWLNDNSDSGASMVIKIRDKVVKLETLNRCKELVNSYL